MNERPGTPLSVITISRQYGSEGGKVAAKLASRLHWHLSDYEIVAHVARALNMPEEEAALYDEHRFNFTDRMILSMQFAISEAVEAWPNQYSIPIWPLIQERIYHEELQQVVETLAGAGNTVIVGHGAQVILANWPGALHVRIVAPFKHRVRNVMQIEQWDEARAQASVRQSDRNQAYYLRSQYHRDSDDPLLYDLVINSSSLDMESQVDLICLALERKASEKQAGG